MILYTIYLNTQRELVIFIWGTAKLDQKESSFTMLPNFLFIKSIKFLSRAQKINGKCIDVRESCQSNQQKQLPFWYTKQILHSPTWDNLDASIVGALKSMSFVNCSQLLPPPGLLSRLVLFVPFMIYHSWKVLRKSFDHEPPSRLYLSFLN